MKSSCFLGPVLAVCFFAAQTAGAAPKDGAGQIKILKTPGGVRFGLLGEKGSAPAPTLFVFATDIKGAIGNEQYNRVGRLLAKHGFLSVALDLPCHGEDIQGKSDSGIAGWRNRLEKGDSLVPAFIAKASGVLDYLVKEGYTDPKRVAAIGTSRGGFIALHLAAADPRVRCAVGFAPVTNLLALTEFSGMEKHAATRKLGVINLADKLSGRPVWICIGNDDQRVSTDDAIAFNRALVRAASAQKKIPLADLHIESVIGHRIHDTAHDEAALWIRKHMDRK